MNRADLVFAICHLIGLRPQKPASEEPWALAAPSATVSAAQPMTR
jgi:hypothetical protein